MVDRTISKKVITQSTRADVWEAGTAEEAP